MKFLSEIDVNREFALPIVDGINGQVITTDGQGNTYWGSVSIGALNLDGLQDVVITTPSSGQILRYGIPVGSEDPNPVWYNYTPNYLTPSSSIDNLSDVAITSATTGQLLQWNGSAWINWTPNYLTAHPAIVNGGSVNNSLGTVVQDITVDANGHVTAIGSVNLDTRYYTQDDITALFGGDTAIAGYNLIDWDAAYADKINSASFSTTTGVLTLTQQDTGTITVDLDGRYLQSFTETDPTVPSHVKSITATDISNWNSAVNDSIRSGSFNTDTGVLTLTQVDLGAVTVDLDGRYLESLPVHTHTIADVTGLQTSLDGKVPTTRTLTINGTAFDLSADRSWTISSADGYISDVRLTESTLEFTGEGSAFTGNIDLSTLPFASSSHNHDDRYYTETESDSRFLNVSGDTITGKIALNDSAYFTGAPSHGFRWNSSNDAFNNVIMYDNGNMYVRGSVGIGTSSPIDKLHIVGGLTSTSISVPSNTDVGSLQFGYDGTNGLIRSWNSSPIIYQAYNYQSWETSGIERMRITAAGNVGIGTTSPRAGEGTPLTIESSTGYVGISLSGTGSYANVWQLYASGDGASNKFFGIYDRTNSAYRLVTTSAGNVGIGTTAPSEKLDVAGNIRIASNDGYISFNTSASSGDPKIKMGSDGDFSFQNTAGSTNLHIENGGNVGIGTAAPSEKLDVVGNIKAQYNGNNYSRIGQNSSGGYLQAYSGAVERIMLRSYGDSFINGGNVGIGTTSPTNALHIKNEGYQIKLEDGNTTNTAEIVASNNSLGFFSDRANSVASSDMLFSIDNSTKMYISTAGNVGIGTTSPSTKLHVNGVITATGGNSTNWNAAYSWGNHANAGYFKLEGTEPITIQAETVTFTGNVTVEGTFTESSSIRFKENITPLDPALEKVNQLEAVSYNKIGVDDREIGLIAEDVAELFPEVVTYNEEGQPQGIQYQRLSVILLKAVQELTERVNKLENK